MSIAIFSPVPVMALSTKEFPVPRFKVLAALQIVVGSLCIAFSLGNIGISYRQMSMCEKQRDDYFEQQILDNSHIEESVADVGDFVQEDCWYIMMGYLPWVTVGFMVSGIVYIITGCIALGTARSNVAHRQAGMKTAYTVLCMFGTFMFAPMVVSCGVYQIYYSQLAFTELGNMPVVALGGLQTALGIVMFVMSIVAGSISCCCSPVCEEVKVIGMPQMMAPPMSPPPTTNEKVPLPDHEEVSPDINMMTGPEEISLAINTIA